MKSLAKLIDHPSRSSHIVFKKYFHWYEAPKFSNQYKIVSNREHTVKFIQISLKWRVNTKKIQNSLDGKHTTLMEHFDNQLQNSQQSLLS
jgi:hypothetical protein